MRHFTVEEAGAVLPEVEQLLRRLRVLRDEARAGEAAEVVDRLAAIGCLLRDVDLGLIDFPSWAGGSEIFLCWRLGEVSIQFWHGTAEGYAGRKPLSALPRGSIH